MDLLIRVWSFYVAWLFAVSSKAEEAEETFIVEKENFVSCVEEVITVKWFPCLLFIIILGMKLRGGAGKALLPSRRFPPTFPSKNFKMKVYVCQET